MRGRFGTTQTGFSGRGFGVKVSAAPAPAPVPAPVPAPSSIFTDNFNRSTAAATVEPVGNGWLTFATGSFSNAGSNLAIKDNKLVAQTFAFSGIHRLEIRTNSRAKIKIDLQSGAGGTGLSARLSDGSNGYVFLYETSTFDGFYKVVGGAFTRLASPNIAREPTSGDFLEFEITGTLLTARIYDANGIWVETVSVNDATFASGYSGVATDSAQNQMSSYSLENLP